MLFVQRIQIVMIVLDDVDADAEDVLNELNLISENEDANLNENRDGDWNQVGELKIDSINFCP